MKGPLRSHQTVDEVMMEAEGEEKEMQVTRLGQCFWGNSCHTNTETDRDIGRPWSGWERCPGGRWARGGGR